VNPCPSVGNTKIPLQFSRNFETKRHQTAQAGLNTLKKKHVCASTCPRVGKTKKTSHLPTMKCKRLHQSLPETNQKKLNYL
jgi:hypothetical protein